VSTEGVRLVFWGIPILARYEESVKTIEKEIIIKLLEPKLKQLF
jgi:hypothetical protein